MARFKDSLQGSASEDSVFQGLVSPKTGVSRDPVRRAVQGADGSVRPSLSRVRPLASACFFASAIWRFAAVA